MTATQKLFEQSIDQLSISEFEVDQNQRYQKNKLYLLRSAVSHTKPLFAD